MNTNEPKKTTLPNSILEAIKKGEVKMRPKWHFVVQGLLLAVGTVLVSLTLIYLISFIFFMLRQNGVLFAPEFGLHGIRVFVFSLPWILIGVSLLFIGLLEILVRKYSFGYRRPLLYSALAIICMVLVGGFVVAQTSFHDQFYRQARDGRLPIAGQFYRGYGMQKLQEVHPCLITELTQNGFNATDPRNESVTVIITSETRFPRGTNFSVGERVLVIGERASSTITAFGIRKIDDTLESAPRPIGPKMKLQPFSQNP